MEARSRYRPYRLGTWELPVESPQEPPRARLTVQRGSEKKKKKYRPLPREILCEAEKMNSCASRAHTSNFHFARSGSNRLAGFSSLPRLSATMPHCQSKTTKQCRSSNSPGYYSRSNPPRIIRERTTDIQSFFRILFDIKYWFF